MNLRRDVFQAIADPTRRAILLLVASQSLTAGSIAANFHTARPTVSKHLQILTECELLEQEQNDAKNQQARGDEYHQQFLERLLLLGIIAAIFDRVAFRQTYLVADAFLDEGHGFTNITRIFNITENCKL